MAAVLVLAMGMQMAAQPARAVDAIDPAALTEMVKPYLRGDTCALTHVDLARVDMKALHTHLSERMATASLPPDDLKDALQTLDDGMKTSETWVADMIKTGGRHVFQYFVFTANGQDTVQIVLLEPGANARAIQGLIASGKADGDTSNAKMWENNPQMRQYIQQAEVVGNAVVMGTRTRIDRITKGNATNRPEVTDAIAAAGDAPACMLIVPTDVARTQIEKGAGKTLPPFLGGGPVTNLTRGIQWITICGQQSPAISALAVAQCKDEATAKTDQNSLASAIRFLTIMPAAQDSPTWGLMVAGITPTVDGTQVKIALDAASLDMRLPMFASVLSSSRKQMKMFMSQNNIRQIMMACNRYSKLNKGAWPDDLKSLVTASKGMLNAATLKDPRRPDLDVGYEYIKPTR